MNETTVVADPNEPTITITRVFDASRALVWQAMSTPELIERWWGPRGGEMITCKLDMRVGGTWRFVLRHNGREDGFSGEYREIVPRERLVQTFVYDPYPQAVAVETMTLADHGAGKTMLKVVQRHVSMEARNGMLGAGMEPGLNETYGRLDDMLVQLGGRKTTKLVAEPGKPTIVITREFDGPRHMVWKAVTQPELVKRWWGPRGTEFDVCEMDVRAGGSWKFVARVCGRPPVAFWGEYREVVANEKLVQTRVFEMFPDAPAVETMTLTDLPGGKTLMTIVMVQISVEARDGMVASGMEAGIRESHDRLDELVRAS